MAYELLLEKAACTIVVGGLVTEAFKETVSPEQITESVTDALTGICCSVTVTVADAIGQVEVGFVVTE